METPDQSPIAPAAAITPPQANLEVVEDQSQQIAESKKLHERLISKTTSFADAITGDLEADIRKDLREIAIGKHYKHILNPDTKKAFSTWDEYLQSLDSTVKLKLGKHRATKYTYFNRIAITARIEEKGAKPPSRSAALDELSNYRVEDQVSIWKKYEKSAESKSPEATSASLRKIAEKYFPYEFHEPHLSQSQALAQIRKLGITLNEAFEKRYKENVSDTQKDEFNTSLKDLWPRIWAKLKKKDRKTRQQRKPQYLEAGSDKRIAWDKKHPEFAQQSAVVLAPQQPQDEKKDNAPKPAPPAQSTKTKIENIFQRNNKVHVLIDQSVTDTEQINPEFLNSYTLKTKGVFIKEFSSDAEAFKECNELRAQHGFKALHAPPS